MRKPCGFKCISWMLVFSILHLQFSSLAYGGHDKEGLRGEGSGRYLSRPLLEDRDCSYGRYGKENWNPEVPDEVCVDSDIFSKKDVHRPRSAPSPKALEEPPVYKEVLQDQVGACTGLDSEVAVYVHTVFGVLEEQKPGPSFLRTFSTLHHALNPNEEIASNKRTAICVATAINATLASGARALLFLSNGIVGGFLVPSAIGAKTPPFPLGFSIGAGCAGALSWPDNCLFSEEILTKAVRFFRSPHTPIIEDLSIGKTALLVVTALPRIIGFTVEAFVYVNTMASAPLLSISIFAIPTGVSYLALRLAQGFTDTLEGWPRALDVYDQLWGVLQRNFGNPQATLPQEISLNGESVKRDIRVHLAQGKRKVMSNPAGAMTLYRYIENISQEISKVHTELQKNMETLAIEYEALPEKTLTAQEIYKTNQANLQNQLEMVQRVGEWLIFQAYYNFDKEGKYPAGSGHPLFYKVAQGVGAIIGGAASGSIWYGLASMGSSMEFSPIKTIVTATLATAVFIPYLAINSARAFSQLVSYIKGYHPIANTPTIEEHTLLRSTNLQAILAFLNMLRGIYLALPTSLLGPQGMVQNGIWPGAPRIGPEALPTTASSMAAWGLVEHNNSKRLQDKATEIIQGINKKASAVGSWVKRRFGRAKIANEGEALLDAEEKMQDRFPHISEENLATKARKQFGEGKEFQLNLQQHLVTQYDGIDNWLRRLSGKQILALDHYLRTPVEEWFISGRYTPPTPPEPVASRPAVASFPGNGNL